MPASFSFSICRQHRLFLGALALVVATSSGWCASSEEFRSVLDSFTGEWKGEIRVHALDGYLLKTFEAQRSYSWDGDEQVVETRFSDGSQQIIFRDVRSVQLGRLHSRVAHPGMAEEEYGGDLGEAGIVWTNVQRNNRDIEERLIMNGDSPAIEASSIEVMRVTGVSGIVRVSMHFEPGDGRVVAGSASSAEVARLQKQVEDLETRLSESGGADAALDELRSERDALADQLDAAQTETKEYLATIEKLEAERDQLNERLSKAEPEAGRIADLAATVADLELKNDSAEKDIEQLKAELSSARDETAAASGALEKTQAEASQFSERVDELTAAISEAHQANDVATGKIEELDRALLESKNEIETLRTEAKGITEERDALAAQLASAQSEGALASEQQSTNLELQRELEAAQADRDKNSARAAELAGQLEAMRADLEKLRSGADGESVQIDQLQRELAAARAEVESRDAEVSRMKSQLAAAEKDRSELAANAAVIQELTDARDRAVAESSNLSRKLETLEAELTTVRSDAGSESARVEELQAQLAAANSEFETQTNEVARLNTRLSETESERNDATVLAAERDSLRSRVADLETQLAVASESANAASAEHEALESRPDITVEALELERRENQRRYEQAEGGRLDSLGRLTELEAELKPLRDEITLRDREIAGLKQTLASLKVKGDGLEQAQAKVRELEGALEEETVKSAAERDSSRAQIVALEQNVDELESVRTNLDTLRSLAEQRQQDNENLVKRVDELTTERGQLMVRVSSLETELANVSTSAPAVTGGSAEPPRAVVAVGDDLVDRVERLDRRVIELESERNSLRNREEMLQAQLKEASELRDGTLARFQDVVSQLNAMRKERDRLARANVSMEADLRAAQAQRTLVKSEAAAAPDDGEGGIISRIMTSIGSDTAESPREIDRTIASYEVIGVTASENGDKAILNGRVYHGGDVVDVNLGIVFQRIDGDTLVFIDDDGREYRRRF